MRYGELKLLERSGAIAGLRLHPAFSVEIAGYPYCTYTADFSYWQRQDGAQSVRVVEEIKSTGTAKDTAYRLRKKAAELYHRFQVTEVIR